MRTRQFVYILCGLTTTCLLSSYPPAEITPIANPSSPASSQADPTLLDALRVIGSSQPDLQAFQTNGTISPGLVQTFTQYAQNSDNSVFDALSQTQSNRLVLFGFLLLSQNQIPQAVMDTLMAAEKRRAGVSDQDIATLNTLSQNIQNSSYTLTPDDVVLIKRMLPFIAQSPFAFADVIGPLISAFVINEEDNPSVDDDIESTLTNAAQDLSQLTDEQIENVTNITQNYQTTQEFDPSDDDMDTLNQALALSLLPLGAYALYPLIGSDDVYAVGEITRNYEGRFNPNYVHHYNGEVGRNWRNEERDNLRPGDRTPGQRGPGDQQRLGQRRADGQGNYRGQRGNLREANPGANNGRRAGIRQGGNQGARRNSLDRSRGGGRAQGFSRGGGPRGGGGGPRGGGGRR